MTTRRKSELSTITAEPGHEIIALNIVKGCLEGSMQQPAPELACKTKKAAWYVVARVAEHEDDCSKPGYEHFETKSAALKRWGVVQSETRAKLPGRAAMLVDAMKLVVLKEAGGAAATPGSASVISVSKAIRASLSSRRIASSSWDVMR